MKNLFVFTIIMISVNVAFGQYFGAISLDHPGQSVTYSTVKKMRLQIESGFNYFSDKNFPDDPNRKRIKIQLARTTLRFGLSKKIELRLGSQFTYQKDQWAAQKKTIRSLEGVSVGTKLKLFAHRGLLPDGALLVFLRLPLGSTELISKKVEPTALLIGSHPLSEATRLEYNLGASYCNADYFEYLLTLLMRVHFSKMTSAFIEYTNTNPENALARQLFDFGLSFLVKRNFAFDIFGGKGLNKAAPDWFVSIGGGIRLPN